MAPILIACLALACGIACVVRRPKPFGALALRMASVTLLAIVVASPARWVDAREEAPVPSVTVLVDRSASMDALAPDVGSMWSQERLDVLREHATITVIDHAGDALDAGSERSRESSPLRATIGAVLERGDADHLVLLTDGIDTTGGSLADLSPQEARVHALALDPVRTRVDARVFAMPATALAYSGQRAT